MDIDGKELVVQPSSFINTMQLKNAIGKALAVKDLDLNSIDISSENPDVGSNTLGAIIENAISVATDPKVMECLFKCCDKVVMLDKNLVTPEFFDNVENRKYYYQIMLEVIKVNISPFFEKISSMLSGAGELMEKLQKQK